MDNNAKIGDLEKSNKNSMKKKVYGKSGEDENKALLKNEVANDSTAFSNQNKSKFYSIFKLYILL